MFPTPWSQRTLEFGRSLDELPVLLERVQGTTARINALIARQPLENLHLRVQGKWSVMEQIGHLLHLQDRFEPRVQDFEERRDQLSHISLEDQGSVLQGHRLRSIGDVMEEFRLKRAAFVARLERMHRDVLEHVAYHPCQHKRMRPVDMLLWIAEHDDHHLASIRAILKTAVDGPRAGLWPE